MSETFHKHRRHLRVYSLTWLRIQWFKQRITMSCNLLVASDLLSCFVVHMLQTEVWHVCLESQLHARDLFWLKRSDSAMQLFIEHGQPMQLGGKMSYWNTTTDHFMNGCSHWYLLCCFDTWEVEFFDRNFQALIFSINTGWISIKLVIGFLAAWKKISVHAYC